MHIFRDLIHFLKDEIWRLRVGQMSAFKSFCITQLRILLLSLKGFTQDKCQLRASALTFYSLLAIVPIAALLFGIAKGFGLEKILQDLLYARLVGQEEVVEKIIIFAQTMLETTREGVIAGIGLVLLLWSALKVLSNIEGSFNHIWGIKKSRSLIRKFSDYLAILIVCPILLVLSSSATVLLASQIKIVAEKISLLEGVAPFIFLMLKILPFCALWIVFTFMYISMPNTKVRFRAALMGGIIGGTLFQILQSLYLYFQIGATQYGAIYGSFAALPLFLIWLYFSWLIVLFGAEVSFAEQNVNTYEFEPDASKTSRRFKLLIALVVTQKCIKNFATQSSAQSAEEIAQDLDLPIRLLKEVLHELQKAGVISEVVGDKDYKEVYQPARAVDTLTVKSVLEALENCGVGEIPITDSVELQTLSKSLETFDRLAEGSEDNYLLKELGA